MTSGTCIRLNNHTELTHGKGDPVVPQFEMSGSLSGAFSGHSLAHLSGV